MPLHLSTLPGIFAICRLAPDADLPAWADSGPFSSVTRTGEELSIVAARDRVPTDIPIEGAWRAFKVAGPIPLSAVGVLAAITDPLARAAVSLFVVSTFDTDYVLVRVEQHEAARIALLAAGHIVT